MSAGFPYLQKLRKTELLEFAEATDMQKLVVLCSSCALALSSADICETTAMVH